MENIIKEILNQNKIIYKDIKKSKSGFSNFVYFIDNNYVVKLNNNPKYVVKLLKEIEFYKNNNLLYIPKFISSGDYNDYKYIILEQISGKPLYKIWHTFNSSQREIIIQNIANILNNFHNLNYDFLPAKDIWQNFCELWKIKFKNNIKELNSRGFNTFSLQKFCDEKLEIIFKQQKNGLVFNDAHFDNFIYNGKKLFLIDFDRIMYCSIDYELLIIKSMIDNPKKFANEQDEQNVNSDDYKEIWNWLKKYSPQFFDFEFFEERLFVYQFIYNLGNAYEYNKDDLIKQELQKFKKYFKL